VALSYEWGTPSADHYAILLNGREFVVRDNLLVALTQFRYDAKDTPIWIDAICINQENIQERNDQVTKMGYIFQCASVVYAWAGLTKDGSDIAIQLAHDLFNIHDDKEILYRRLCRDGIKEELQALYMFLIRPY
jgi:hypothetical protein